MANLLRWSVGMALPKKKEENNILTTSTPLIRSLRTMNPTITNNKTTNNSFRTQQNNDFARQQQEAQRRQQEEQQRQQRVAEQQRQQEQRKQQEQAKRLAEQRLREQKQRNLLNSAGLGNSGFGATDLRSNLEARKQAIAKRQQEAAAKKAQQEQNQVDSALKTVNNDARTKYNDLFKDEGNGWSNNSYWTKYRDNGATANKYSSIYGESQQDLNRALRTIMSKDDDALGDADRIVSAYSKLSNDEKWSATQDLQKAATKIQQAMAKADNEDNIQARDSYGQALDYINTYQNLISGVDKGQKSLLKSLTDTAQSGGFVGDMANPWINLMGNVTGNSDISKRTENESALARSGNNGLVSGIDKIGSTVGNIALNVATGGKYGITTSGLNLANEIASAFNDKDREYYVDANGKVQRQNRTNEQKLSSIGVAGLSLGLSALGMAGKGPNIEFASGKPLQSLIANKQYGEIAKGLLRYAADETPFALLTSAGETGIRAIGDGGEAWNEYGNVLLDNIIGDLSMDIAGAVRYGKTGNRDMFRVNQDNGKLELDDSIKNKLSDEDNAKVQKRLDDFQEGVKQAVDQEGKTDLSKTDSKVDLSKVETTQDGTMVKTNTDGTATKLSDAELANVVEQRASQPSTVKGLNPFIENSVKLNSSEDIATLAKRAEQGDTYAKQRLAELIGQEEQNTDWRGKSVEEVINSNREETSRRFNENHRSYEDISKDFDRISDALDNDPTNKQLRAEYNKIANELNAWANDSTELQRQNRAFNAQEIAKLSPAEQKAFIDTQNSPAVYTAYMSDQQLANLAKEYGIDISGKSRGEVEYEIQEIVRGTRVIPGQDEQQSIAGRIKDEVQNIKDGAAALGQMLTGQNRLQPAYAGAGETIKYNSDGLTNKTKNKAYSEMTIEPGAAPDGGDLVASDYPVSRDLPQKEAAREARQNLKKIQGRTIKLGDSDIEATFNKKNRGELMRRNDTMSGNQYRAKVDMAGNADELFSTARDVRVEPNRKPNQKPDVIGYVKGKSYGQDGSGKVYEMSVKSEINKNGATNPHSITSINEVPGGIIRKSGDQVRNAQAPRSASNIPQNNANVKNKSQFANETVQNSPEVSRDLKKQVRNEKATYRQTSNAEHLAASEKFMNTHTLSEAEADITNRVLNKKLGKITDQDVSDAIAVAKALDAKGDTASLERASAIYESLSKHATQQGQNIQALSLLNNRTPEGLRYGAEKAIRKSGTEVTPEIHKQVLQNTDSIVKSRRDVSKAQKGFDEISKRATELYNKDNKNISSKDYKSIMTDLGRAGRRLNNAKYELDLAYARLSKTVNDNKKQSIGDIYSSVHKAGLLSAPTTHIRNITSNATFGTLKKISDVPATGLDWLVSKFTGKRTKALTMRGELEGTKKGLKYGAETMRTGLDELNNSNKYSSGYPEIRFKKHKVADAIIGKPSRIIFRAMSAGDKPFRYASQANSLYDQAIAQAKNLGLSGKGQDIFVKQFVNDPPQAALEIAQADGERAVLGQSNKVAEAINGLVQKAKNSDNIGWRALGTYLDSHVVPFNKVPTNFLIETSNYTPIGAGKEVFKIINDAKHGKAFDQRTFVESMSKAGLGTAGVLALGGMLASNFTGEYPDDEKERNRWEAEGIKENSIKIGNRYIPLDAFGPDALLIGAGATFWKSLEAGDSATDATGEAMTQLLRNLEDQSFLTGISNVIDLAEGKTTTGMSISNYIKQEAASNIPNAVKKLASATDPYVRSTGKKTGIVEQTVASIMNSIPVLRELLPAKVDAYGNDLKNGAFLTGFLDPSGSGYALQDGNEMVEEVARLHKVAGELGLTDEEKKELEVTPSDVEYKFGAKGSEVQLTDDEQRELTKITGGLISTTWQDIMNSDDYKNSDDLRKARLLADGRQAAVNLAKQQFADAHGYTAPKMTSDAKALENGSFKASAKGDTARNNAIEANDSISNDSKSILEKYNSMTSEDWDKYLYGTTAESAAAEYNLAKAKYENDLANDKLTEPQKIKREKELAKLEVSQKWTKEYRDAYSLAGTKADMQAYLNGLDAETRAKTVATLNGLNNAMYNAGIITASTYKTRYNAINNTTSSKSGSRKSSSTKSEGISSAEASALASLAKTMAKTDDNVKIKTPEAPTTKRKMSKTKSSGNKTQLATYTPSAKKSISVSKGARRSIA